MLDEVRAGGRIPLIIGRGLTEKARAELGLGPTDLFKKPEAPIESTKGFTLAQAVLAGLRQAGVPAASWIADGYGHFDPTRPDPFASFAVPASPNFTNLRPLGDETNQ